MSRAQLSYQVASTLLTLKHLQYMCVHEGHMSIINWMLARPYFGLCDTPWPVWPSLLALSAAVPQPAHRPPPPQSERPRRVSGGGAQAFQHAQESAVALEVDDLCGVCVCVYMYAALQANLQHTYIMS